MREITRQFSLPFYAKLDNSNQHEFLEIVNGSIVDQVLPSNYYDLNLTLRINHLDMVYSLPSLRRNPVPEIDDLASRTAQTASIINHKETYHPNNGYAYEITFYGGDFVGETGGNGWQNLSRDYFYNVGGVEQRQNVLGYLTSSDFFVLGRQHKIGARISLPQTLNLGIDDYFIFSGQAQGTFTCFALPNLDLKYRHHQGTAVSGETILIPDAKRLHFLLSNFGPGRLYFSFRERDPALQQRTAWINPNQSILFESGVSNYSQSVEFNTSVAINSQLFNYGVLPDASVFLSSDDTAEFGCYQAYI